MDKNENHNRLIFVLFATCIIIVAMAVPIEATPRDDVKFLYGSELQISEYTIQRNNEAGILRKEAQRGVRDGIRTVDPSGFNSTSDHRQAAKVGARWAANEVIKDQIETNSTVVYSSALGSTTGAFLATECSTQTGGNPIRPEIIDWTISASTYSGVNASSNTSRVSMESVHAATLGASYAGVGSANQNPDANETIIFDAVEGATQGAICATAQTPATNNTKLARAAAIGVTDGLAYASRHPDASRYEVTQFSFKAAYNAALRARNMEKETTPSIR